MILKLKVYIKFQKIMLSLVYDIEINKLWVRKEIHHTVTYV